MSESKLKFIIDYPREDDGTLVEGRILLFLGRNGEKEPRYQINDKAGTAMVFGIDAIGDQPSKGVTIDGNVFGYPLKSLDDIPAGEYWVQGLLHRYETFDLKTGHTVKLPMDRGEGQHWHAAPGNNYSVPKRIFLDPIKGFEIKVQLDQEIPPIEQPNDTKYIKHVRIKSELLS